jgi:hypothetical protein
MVLIICQLSRMPLCAGSKGLAFPVEQRHFHKSLARETSLGKKVGKKAGNFLTFTGTNHDSQWDIDFYPYC